MGVVELVPNRVVGCQLTVHVLEKLKNPPISLEARRLKIVEAGTFSFTCLRVATGSRRSASRGAQPVFGHDYPGGRLKQADRVVIDHNGYRGADQPGGH